MQDNSKQSLLKIVGDAQISAYYRLGIGINNAFSSLEGNCYYFYFNSFHTFDTAGNKM